MNKPLCCSLAVLLLGLQGCAVGPDFRRPQTPQVPAVFSAAAAAAEPLPVADDAFWARFEDPELTALVTATLASNYSLLTALANYDAANALLRQAKFDQMPTVTASADARHQRLARDDAGATARSQDRYANQATLGWELDLFGRVRRSLEAQSSLAAARADDLRALQVAVVGEVASTYIDLRAAQRMLVLANANADSQRHTLAIVQQRLDAGRDARYDLDRAQAQLQAALARVPAFEARIAVDKHRLSVLAGLAPAALDARLARAMDMPQLPAAIAVGTPADLLRRRPDVAAAEHQLHAATARVGVATADLFPRLSLGAAIGTAAFNGSELYASGSGSSLAVLGIDWSFLDIGRVRSRIAAADADAAGRLAAYQQTVLGALEDVENALVRLSRSRQEYERLGQAAAGWRSAAVLADARYQSGAIELFELLEVQRSSYDASLQEADSQARTTANAVGLFVSLAGGWPQTVPTRTTAPVPAAP
ncbi:MAG: Outer membrane protein OprM [Stenotrophomonas maltophilia]|uniref:Outer membrane protein OprM n=1 Tax=Stenotrophomonas maltophilia TaxID=40324 RepID=A0A7V8JLD0_STEMA|nr:MAG: Outer membrane protein OprM [Stenotrophomonas maltophilia]